MASFLIKKNMRLFGLPYQFLPSVDIRDKDISPTVGRKFIDNIILDAPVVTLIPGKPKYMSGGKGEKSNAELLLNLASDNFDDKIKAVFKSESANDGTVFKYYDFERAYTEYMQYVNILCRTCASFLEIKELINGVSCQRYDYRNYKWNTDSGKVTSDDTTNISNNVSGNANSTVNITASDTSVVSNLASHQMIYETPVVDGEEGDIDDLLTTHNYVQFFVDPDASANESMSNSTTESKMKGYLNTASDASKEIAFIANSGGLDSSAIQNYADDALQSIVDAIGNDNKLTDITSRIISLGSNVVRGENAIIPDIYQNSAYEKSYTFTVHLKSPYGTKFGYFMDICVPLMHLIGLGLPKQTSANSYGSPFLVKAYCDGIFTCNMGMVTSISISKGVNSAYSVDGLPTEVDVSITLTDLYSDLSMSPQSSALLFTKNDSLVEYLATTCGLSLITPNLSKKIEMTANNLKNMFRDVDNTVVGFIKDKFDNFVMDFAGLGF